MTQQVIPITETSLIAAPRGIPQLLQADLKISNEDVLSVAMCQAEDMLRAQLEAAKNTHDALKTQCDDLSEKVNKAIHTFVQTTGKQKAGPFQKCARAMGYTDMSVACSYQPVQSPGRDGKPADRANITVTISARMPAKATTDKYARLASPECSITFNFVHPMPADVIKLQQEHAKRVADREEAYKSLMAFRAQLSNLPSMERQFKGQLAKIRLSKTAEGQQLLDEFLAGIEDRVRKLPAK